MEHRLFNHRSVQLVPTDEEKQGFLNLFFIAHCYNTLHIHCTIILLYQKTFIQKIQFYKTFCSSSEGLGIKHGALLLCRLTETGDKILAILFFLYIHIGKRESCYALEDTEEHSQLEPLCTKLNFTEQLPPGDLFLIHRVPIPQTRTSAVQDNLFLFLSNRYISRWQFKAVSVQCLMELDSKAFQEVIVLRFADINKLFLWGRTTSVPAASAITSLDTGVVLGLVPIQLSFYQPVCPEALVWCSD